MIEPYLVCLYHPSGVYLGERLQLIPLVVIKPLLCPKDILMRHIDAYEEEGIPCYGIGGAVRYELTRCIQFGIGFLKGQPPFSSFHRCVIGVIHDSELPIAAEGQPPRGEYHLRLIPKPVSEDRQPYPVGIIGSGLGGTLGCAPDVLDPNIECRLPSLGYSRSVCHLQSVEGSLDRCGFVVASVQKGYLLRPIVCTCGEIAESIFAHLGISIGIEDVRDYGLRDNSSREVYPSLKTAPVGCEIGHLSNLHVTDIAFGDSELVPPLVRCHSESNGSSRSNILRFGTVSRDIDYLTFRIGSSLLIVILYLLYCNDSINPTLGSLDGRIDILVVIQSTDDDTILRNRIGIVNVFDWVEFLIGISRSISLGRIAHSLTTVMLGFPPLDIITEGLSTKIGEIDVGKLGNPIGVALKERIIGSLLEIVCREVLLSSPAEKPVAYLCTLHLSLDTHQASLKAVLKDMAQILGIITYKDIEYSVLIGLYPPTHPVDFVDLLQYIPYIGIGYVKVFPLG